MHKNRVWYQRWIWGFGYAWERCQAPHNIRPQTVTSLHVFLCVFDQVKKCWIIIRHKCLDVVGHTSIGDARIQCGRFCFPLFPFEYLISFRVLGETMAGYTWNLNTVRQNKVELSLAMIKTSFALGCKERKKKVCHMAAWINLIIFGLFPLFF